MKKILTLIFVIILLAGCKQQEDSISINSENVTSISTPVQEPTPQVTTINATDKSELLLPNEDITFKDILPNDITSVEFEYWGSIYVLKESFTKEFIDFISEFPLYSEINYDYQNPTMNSIDFKINGNFQLSLRERQEIIAIYDEDNIKKEYMLVNKKHEGNVEPIITFWLQLAKNYLIPIFNDGDLIDSYTILNYEDMDIKIYCDHPDTVGYEYPYSYIVNKINLDGFEIYENGVLYKELPSTVGIHAVTLKKDVGTYRLRYYVD